MKTLLSFVRRVRLSSLTAIVIGATSLFSVGFAQTVNVDYDNAVTKTHFPIPTQWNNNLIPVYSYPERRDTIIGFDKYILVVTWKKNPTYYPASGWYNTANRDIWTTLAPELTLRMNVLNPPDSTKILRVEQLLGLQPDSKYDTFVEFWVKPEDLFRPCPDNEIGDRNCDFLYPANADINHVNWMLNNKLLDYAKYPWTQLGYTYDWNPSNASHFGLSEFVIKRNKAVYLRKKWSNADYLQ